MSFKVLVIGDVVGSPGRDMLRDFVRPYVKANGVDFVIANGENAAGGMGISPPIATQFFEWGVDVITTGDHVWKKKDIIQAIQTDIRIVRPANYPSESPGRGWTCVRALSGQMVGVVNLVGRTYMQPAECPFKAADAAMTELLPQTKVILVDMHAEATSEKLAMGWHLDGRASAVYGTHTHVQTADERLLARGTAYITDIGMTGPAEGVIGMRRDTAIHRSLSQMPLKMTVQEGPAEIQGCLVTIDARTGRATAIERIRERSAV